MVGMNLYQASNQWASRPDDERFWNLEDMLVATQRLRDQSREADAVPLRSLTVLPDDFTGQPVLRGSEGVEARFTHYSFGQFCQVARAPADYLRKLPVALVAQNLNHGLVKRVEEDSQANRYLLLRQTNSHLHLCAALSGRYDRIWDCDITERLMGLEGDGWRVPPARPSPYSKISRPATEADCLRNRSMSGLSIQPGDPIAPAGLYASDHDMFAFMVNEDGWLESHGAVLGKGFFLGNSEVGDRAFSLMTFLYNTVCGNHIVWDVQEVKELRVVHLGSGGAGDRAFGRMRVTLKQYAQHSAQEMQGTIERARTVVIAVKKEDLLDTLFARKIAPRKDLEDAYLLAEEHPEDSGHAAPNTVWGQVQGITRLAQSRPHGDDRERLERAAGKVLKIAF